MMSSDNALLPALGPPPVDPDRIALAEATALEDSQLESAVMVFKLLGDPTRARLLYALLGADQLCVGDLAHATGLVEATASQALRLLRMSHIVTSRREGRLVYYRLADDHVRMLLETTREHVAHQPDSNPKEN